MLKTPYCTVLDCHSELKSFEEVATGICSEHSNLLTSNKHYVGVCWNCGAITGVYEIPRRLKGILQEKYLFSKSCSKCSNDIDANTNWITITKLTRTHPWAIDVAGRLSRVDSKIDTYPPHKEHKWKSEI